MARTSCIYILAHLIDGVGISRVRQHGLGRPCLAEVHRVVCFDWVDGPGQQYMYTGTQN